MVCQFFAYEAARIERDLRRLAAAPGSTCSSPRRRRIQADRSVRAHHRADAARQSLLGVQPEEASMEAAPARCAPRGQLPVTIVRPSHTYRCNDPVASAAGIGRRAACGRATHHRPRRRHQPVDADALDRFRATVCAPARQPARPGRGFSHHRRGRAHLGRDPDADGARARPRSKARARHQRYAGPLRARLEGGRYTATSRPRRSSTTAR